VLPLAASDPLLSFNDLHLGCARNQREREDHQEAVDDGDSTRGFHAAPLVGV
jgi:hypothetical protein